MKMGTRYHTAPMDYEWETYYILFQTENTDMIFTTKNCNCASMLRGVTDLTFVLVPHVVQIPLAMIDGTFRTTLVGWR